MDFLKRRNFFQTVLALLIAPKVIVNKSKQYMWTAEEPLSVYIEIIQAANKRDNTLMTHAPAVYGGVYRNGRTNEIVRCVSHPIKRYDNKLAYYTRQWGKDSPKFDHMKVGDKLYILGLAYGV